MSDPLTYIYRRAPTEKGPLDLGVDLYPVTQGPVRGTIVWIHAGGFTSGTRRARAHPRFARAFNAAGYNILYPSYRLMDDKPQLNETARVLYPLFREARNRDEGLKDHFTRHLAIAAVEDIVSLLTWIDRDPVGHRLQGPVCLAGSSAGAITALNTVSLHSFSGLDWPDNVSSIFAASGAFAYDSARLRTDIPVLAVHNPQDSRVPIHSMNRLAADHPDTVTLMISTAAHGYPGLYDAERAFRIAPRIVDFDLASPRKAARTLPQASLG